MICKFFEIVKYKDNINFYLFYGENEGQKLETIRNNFINFNKENTYKYNEKDIINNNQIFFERIYSSSFFEKEKLLLISDITDKFLNLVEETLDSKIADVTIILLAKKLEKKSKIRNLFEKNKKTLIVPFYEDTIQNLILIGKKILNENKISLSQENLNLIIERSQGDRINLKNELEKIISLSKNKKKLEVNDILKLTNLSENYSASELADNCLRKNRKKTLNILNENIFTNEDCIIITRTMLKKTKKLLKLVNNFNENKNLDKTINNAKPPIFWKEKEITKQQINKWSTANVGKLISDINKTELEVKKIPTNSINIITNFLLEKSQ